MSTEKCEDAGGYVVEHDAGAGGEGFELADGPGLEDVEEAEENEGQDRVGPVGGAEMRVMSWPATSSITMWPGSSRPDSRATVVAAGMPVRMATIAAIAVAVARVAGVRWRVWAAANQRIRAAMLP